MIDVRYMEGLYHRGAAVIRRIDFVDVATIFRRFLISATACIALRLKSESIQ